MSSGFQIDNLANHLHFLQTLSQWYHQEFSHLTAELTLEQRQQQLVQHTNSNTLPFSFVAFNNDRLLGGLCLVEYDIESHLHFTPWLSRIFVHQQARGQLVARQLIKHAINHIKCLGHENLYLLTEHQQLFFTREGFAEVEKAGLNGFPVSIMVQKIR